MGRTEDACPLGEGASGEQFPVWFQAGGPAHLLTEEAFTGLGSQDGGGQGMEATQVRAAPSPRVAEQWGGKCRLAQVRPALETSVPATSHFANERTKVQR